MTADLFGLERTPPRILDRKEAAALVEVLLHRDRSADHRRLCVECVHAHPGWRCAKREAFLFDQLQRCPSFKERNT